MRFSAFFSQRIWRGFSEFDKYQIFHWGCFAACGQRQGLLALDLVRFFEKKRRKKLLSSSTLSRALSTLPGGRVSRQNAFVNEAVEGVDGPAARWL
jgi:hypothetical protein